MKIELEEEAISPQSIPVRQNNISPKLQERQQLLIGQEIEAKVINIEKENVNQGKKPKLRTIITYEIQASDCQSKEEIYKQEVSLSIGDLVKVKIEQVQGASIRKVKRVE